MWKSDLKMSKEKWLLLLISGIILLLLSFPIGGKKSAEGSGADTSKNSENSDGAVDVGNTSKSKISQDSEREYERIMEQRVKDILKNVDGVGQVDVMLTLKSSKEKVLRVDKDKSRSSTEEQDSTGGTRKSTSEDIKESTLLSGGSTTGEPVVEKELQPEIAGIVISAEGGGSALVKTEISEAMEALFNIPAHKVKVLKRVD